MNRAQLTRLRWAVRATLMLGVAASVAANVLHALDNPISQVISAWPPLALLLTVELVSRIPVYRKSLAAVRVLATIAIAGIAAWVSYWHMTSVAATYGEQGASPYLLPVTVDGLIVVASVSLIELAGRIRALADAAAVTQTVAPANVPAPAIVAAPIITPAAIAQPAYVAPAAQPRVTVTATVPPADLNPRTGKAWSVRTERRRRTGR